MAPRALVPPAPAGRATGSEDRLAGLWLWLWTMGLFSPRQELHTWGVSFISDLPFLPGREEAGTIYPPTLPPQSTVGMGEGAEQNYYRCIYTVGGFFFFFQIKSLCPRLG